MTWLLLDAGNTALKWALVPARARLWPAADAAGAGAATLRGSLAIDAPDLGARLADSLAAQLAGRSAPTLVTGCAVAAAAAIAATQGRARRTA